MRNLAVVVMMVAAAAPSMAADWKADFAKHWNISREFTMSVATAMPASDYGFKPSPEEMSFGELMVHIAQSDAGTLARISGHKGPEKPTATDKDSVVQYMNSAFAFCNTELSALTEDQLSLSYGPAGRQVTGKESLWGVFTHMAHHRGQGEVYLRVKGLKPPSYRF